MTPAGEIHNILTYIIIWYIVSCLVNLQVLFNQKKWREGAGFMPLKR